MPVHGADDREKNMETGLAVLFGVCCSVTDCKRRKITLSMLLAGAAAGCILSGIRIWQGTESACLGAGDAAGRLASRLADL